MAVQIWQQGLLSWCELNNFMEGTIFFLAPKFFRYNFLNMFSIHFPLVKINIVITFNEKKQQ